MGQGSYSDCIRKVNTSHVTDIYFDANTITTIFIRIVIALRIAVATFICGHAASVSAQPALVQWVTVTVRFIAAIRAMHLTVASMPARVCTAVATCATNSTLGAVTLD